MSFKLSPAVFPLLALFAVPALPGQQAPAAQKPGTGAAQPTLSSLPAANSPEADRPAVPVAEIVVRINDQVISKADLERANQQLTEDLKEDNAGPEEAEKRRAQLLSDLIDQQLLLSRGKEMNLNPDDEVIRRLDEIRKQYHLDSLEDLEKAARAQGVSFEDFKQNIRNGVITQQVIRQEVSQNVHLTSTDAMAFYEKHRDQFVVPESERLSEILLPAGESDEQVAAARANADKIYQQLKGGSDFATMAKAVSTGPTAQQGGDLGVFKRGQLAKELEDKTFALKAGDITEPVRTKQGFVILKVNEHTNAGVQPYEQVREQVMQEAYNQRMQPALRAYLTKLREDAFIDIKPGYTDIHASPNETKPVFSAYAPPPKKSKKARAVKYRFRDRSQMPVKQPKVEPVKEQPLPGGPTAGAIPAYEQAAAHPAPQPPPPPAPLPNSKQAKTAARMSQQKTTKTTKPVKVRFGQGQKAAQLPPSSTDQAATETSASAAQTAATTPDNDTARLSPESRKILGEAPEVKQPKTRMQNEPHVSRAQAHAHSEQERASEQAPPPDATEVATSKVNSAPLGLNGGTANPPKIKPTEKTRIAETTRTSVPDKPNAGTPGAETYKPDAPVAQTQDQQPKKRHKLFGII